MRCPMHRSSGYPEQETYGASSFIGLALSGVLVLFGLILLAKAVGIDPSRETQPCGIVRGARGEAYNTCL